MKQLENVSLNILHLEEEQLHEYAADCLLQVKLLFMLDEMEAARERLIVIKTLLTQEMAKKQDGKASGLTKDVIMHLMSMTAIMFHLLGDFRNCETLYICYVASIEESHGDSPLLSDCYFQLGVLYYQEHILLKARLCWQKSLSLRSRNKEQAADCIFNLAVLKYRAGDWISALLDFRAVLAVRQECIGKATLGLAHCLEYIAKTQLLVGDSKASLSTLEHAFEIRSALIDNPSHPIVTRTHNQVNFISSIMNMVLQSKHGDVVYDESMILE